MITTSPPNFTYYQQLIDFINLSAGHTEQILLIANVGWQEYEDLLKLFGDDAPVQFTYSQETLQIMSPSRRHETAKEMLGLLLEAYFFERKIRFYPLGSTTLRQERLQKGIEPDQCYCLHQAKEIPDLAIEVVVTSGGINSLEIYRGLGVQEVWFWQNGQLMVYVLAGEHYEQREQSSLLPGLDLELLATYVSWQEPFDAVLEFREKIHGSKK